jgi:hypothetical protein
MPAGWGEEERYAAEVEYGRGVGDDGAEDLARELELVALLRSAGPALSPAPAARSRAKERLMAAFAAQNGSAQHGSTQSSSTQQLPDGHADDTGPIAVIAPVAVADPPEEQPGEPTPLRARHSGRHAAPAEAQAPEADDLGARRLRRSRPQRPGRRPALLGAAAAAALVALAGTGTFASQHALPGDPMYGVKRAAESTGYALTFGEQAKARRHLEQAQRRLDEVEGLVTRAPAARTSGAPADPAEQELVRGAMQEFDTDANEGSRLLLAGPEGAAQADDVRQWAEEQSARLSGLRPAMPAQDKADESLALLDRLLDETAAAQPPCDPAAGPCPTVVEGDPAGATADTAPVPDGVSPSDPSPRTTARGDDDEDAADDPPATDDEQGSSDDGSDDGRRDGSGGSGGSGGGDAAGSDGDLSVPLPLPVPVRVPSVAPGLPGISLG